jgi:hypothetical protein
MNLTYHNTKSEKYYKLNQKRFTSVKPNSELFSALPYRYIDIKTIENNLSNDEEFTRSISNDVYNTLDLNSDKKYVIKYLKYKNRYTFFTLDKEYIDVQKYKYLTYEPLIYSSLFENNLINDNITCFIKIVKSGSFIVFYDGEDYVCSYDIDKFLHSTVYSSFDLNFLREFLVKFEPNSYKLISSILAPLAMLVAMKCEKLKEEYNLDVNKIYLDFDITIDKEYTQILKDTIDSRVDILNIDPLGSDTSSVILSSMLIKTNNQKLNFIIPKSKSANNTYMSKAVASMLLASVVSLSYPLYLASQVVATKVETITLSGISNRLHLDKKRLITDIAKYREYKQKLKVNLNSMKQDRVQMLTSLNEINNKLSYTKSQILSNLTNRLKVTDISVENISLKENNGTNILTMSLQSNNEKEIKYVINELAYLEMNKKSIYRYNNYYKANIEVLI